MLVPRRAALMSRGASRRNVRRRWTAESRGGRRGRRRFEGLVRRNYSE